MARLIFPGRGGEQLVLQSRREPDPLAEPAGPREPRLRALLLRADAGQRHALRRLLAEEHPHETLDRRSHHQLVEMTLELLTKGRLGLWRRAQSTAAARVAPAEPKREVQQEEAETEKPVHWIEVQMLGDDDKPVGLVCWITRPDGQRLERVTDRQGLVRVDGLEDAGQCEVTFPNLDTKTWAQA